MNKKEDFEIDTESGLIVPFTSLSPDVLRGIIEEFVLQEGTDYGGAGFEDSQSEMSLEHKVEQVRRQLVSGKARLVYDMATESCSIQPANRK